MTLYLIDLQSLYDLTVISVMSPGSHELTHEISKFFGGTGRFSNSRLFLKSMKNFFKNFSFPKMSLSDFLSNLKAKLSRKQISEKPLVPSARKKIRRSQKKIKKFESMNEYNNLRKG